jgi:hypothetical protein
MQNYFSDACWAIAIAWFADRAVVAGWLNKFNASLLLLLPFLSEFLQLFGWLPGTFDSIDLLIYFLVTVFFVSRMKMTFPDVQFQLRLLPVFTAFLFMSLACATPKSSYQAPKPLPCKTHKGLNYSPVLVTMYISGSYNMKDLSEAQRLVPSILLKNMNDLNPYKYKMADGEKPNLSLYVTYTSDSYGHFGAEIKGYVFDGDFYTTLSSNYVTWDKLDADIAAKVNSFISYGWCSNCPSPCNP